MLSYKNVIGADYASPVGPCIEKYFFTLDEFLTMSLPKCYFLEANIVT